jgi:hypothetical protein
MNRRGYLLAIGLLATISLAGVQADVKNFSPGWCTFYASREFDRVAARPGMNWGGDAREWLDNAENDWMTTRDPHNLALFRPGTVVVWGASKMNLAGHVGIAKAILVDPRDRRRPPAPIGLLVREMNFGPLQPGAPVGQTVNFGRETEARLLFPEIERRGKSEGYTMPFVGYIFPRPKGSLPNPLQFLR